MLVLSEGEPKNELSFVIGRPNFLDIKLWVFKILLALLIFDLHHTSTFLSRFYNKAKALCLCFYIHNALSM